jgi:7-carboxy-7-deazaguanine synthase
LLKVNEIFYSIQGESSHAGYPCAFIRLTGCNLRCSYCDTTYAYKKGKSWPLEKLISMVDEMGCSLVEITGGEPLLQEETPDLVNALCDKGLRVLVETNGTQDIRRLPERAVCILDIKCPGSGESDKMLWENVSALKSTDEVKFVLTSRQDYTWAKKIIHLHHLPEKNRVLFSPCYNRLKPDRLARWILEDQLCVRLQLQLHKVIWPDHKHGK